MSLTHTLENETLRISIRETGAELCGITSVQTGMDYLWDGDPAVWASYAPVLFPIVGELKESTYLYQGNQYQLPRHGIVRNNPKVRLTDKNENTLTLTLDYDEDTLLVYPFRFRFDTIYILEQNQIIVQHRVENRGENEMYFSVGGHPAFCCPRHKHEAYNDYYLEFERAETVSRWLITDKGLLSGRTEPVLTGTAVLPLTHELFNEDALVFKDLLSTSVSLKSSKSPEVVTVRYSDFPYLGIWAKPQGDYVCIEPWLGVADSQQTDQQFETKEGLIRLASQATFVATYTIEITE